MDKSSRKSASSLTMLGLALLASISTSRAFATTECSILQTHSENSQTQENLWATGFAISTHQLVVNEHSLAIETPNIEIYRDSSKSPISARVVARDFHTDLAVVETTEPLVPCPLDLSNSIKMFDSVQIVGREMDSQSRFGMNARVMAVATENIMIPGVLKGIELVSENPGKLPIRKSMSGSPIFKNGLVVGMISQRTREGTGLAIPATFIKKAVTEVVAGRLAKRNYSFDRSLNKFNFMGLSVSSESQILEPVQQIAKGDPHNRKPIGDPHNGRLDIGDIYGTNGTTSVAGQDSTGYVLAKIENLEELEKFDPILASIVRQTNAHSLLIQSIDGLETGSILDLLRALGTCSKCQIDQFLLKDMLLAPTDKTVEQLLGYVTSLFELLPPGSPGRLALGSYKDLLIVMIRETAVYGAVSAKHMNAAQEKWTKFEAEISATILSEEQNRFYYEILLRKKY